MPSNAHLRVFGEPAKLRDQVRRLIRRGDELLAALDAGENVYVERVRAQPELVEAASAGDRLASVFARAELAMGLDETQSIATWNGAVRRQLQRGLGGEGPRQMREVRLPSRRSFDDEPARLLAAQRAYVRTRLEDLHRVLARLPAVAPSATPQAAEFSELRASGLIEEVQLNAYLKRMAALRTRPQISAAIGAAKELVESVLKAALELLEPQAAPDHDFPKLAKQVRKGLGTRLRGAELELARDAENRFLGGLVSIEHAMAELRNEAGAGHGRPRLPYALSARHAHLAIDTAHAYTRYLVGCLADLRLVQLEPPPA